MTINYTNKKGTVYYLCSKVDNRGRKIYFFSRMNKGEPVDKLPADLKIHENEMGGVSIRKKSRKGKNKLIRQQSKQSKKKRSRQPTSVWQTINRPVTYRKINSSGPPMKGGKVYRPEKRTKPEPFECGWCYQLIWRVLQLNGYYRYYDDKELKNKHKCIRPVHWRPDRS